MAKKKVATKKFIVPPTGNVKVRFAVWVNGKVGQKRVLGQGFPMSDRGTGMAACEDVRRAISEGEKSWFKLSDVNYTNRGFQALSGTITGLRDEIGIRVEDILEIGVS